MARTLYQLVPRNERKALAALLRELRLEAGLRQEDLAARLGTTQNAISNLELGDRRLDVLELRLLCTALNVPVDIFIRRLEQKLHGVGH